MKKVFKVNNKTSALLMICCLLTTNAVFSWPNPFTSDSVWNPRNLFRPRKDIVAFCAKRTNCFLYQRDITQRWVGKNYTGYSSKDLTFTQGVSTGLGLVSGVFACGSICGILGLTKYALSPTPPGYATEHPVMIAYGISVYSLLGLVTGASTHSHFLNAKRVRDLRIALKNNPQPVTGISREDDEIIIYRQEKS